MINRGADRIFSQGLALLRKKRLLEALTAFEEAHQADPANPRYLSYYGLLVGIADNNIQRAISVCREAIERAPFQTEFYLNLCRVYCKAGQRKAALRVLREGLGFDEDALPLKRELVRIDLRRKPFFGFLPRQHRLNRFIGRLTHRE